MELQLLDQFISTLKQNCGNVTIVNAAGTDYRLGVLVRTDDYLKGYSGAQAGHLPFGWANQLHNEARHDNSPGVKISQNLPDDVPDCDLWLNYVPTDFDIGMAWRAKIRSIVYPVLSGADQATSRDIQGDLQANLAVVRLDPGESLVGEFPRIGFDGTGALYTGRFTTDLAKPDNLPAKERVSLQEAATDKGVKAPDLSMPVLTKSAPVYASTNYNDGYDDPLTGVATEISEKCYDSLFMLSAYALVGGAWQAPVSKDARSVEPPRPYGNNIGGLLVQPVANLNNGSDMKIVAWGLNFKGLNPTFHGETLMIQQYLESQNLNELPQYAHLYTTLEPCYMCSGYITTVGRNIKVVSGQDDPNISASGKRKSALRLGHNNCGLYNWQSGSNYPVASFLESMMEQAVAQAEKNPDDKTAQRNIIDFLFGEGAETAYTDELSVLPLFIQKKMELFPDAATEHYATSLANALPVSKRMEVPHRELIGTLWPRANGIAQGVYAGLQYCNEFLDALAKRGVLNPLGATQAKLSSAKKDDPIWNQIPFV
ncbi:hypothetical protein NUH88_04995 [Nisaea acidiphila]|uniref:CMP/dCMP-type deaminase domain-containing protein n=1 Tax=Nisaea acidiphila TaxID=1862145 RepID=A0A9J7AX92_9PROT|nr:deaminase [Nisaea acidiphila]UUX51049.1 hypothetical protein NUH88_04995 [Nisaea acidiphila]